MKTMNPDSAWTVLIERNAQRQENRVAFIAALLMAKARGAADEGKLTAGLTPHMAEAFATEFTRLARRIKALAEADCNTGLNDRQDAENERLCIRFHRLANALGFEASTGGDPRGACAYLIDPDDRKGDGWGDGFAVYS